jgi:hypothetical protein
MAIRDAFFDEWSEEGHTMKTNSKASLMATHELDGRSKMSNIWRCCDCKKFVHAGVSRCLSCSLDHGAMKRYLDLKPVGKES